MGPDSQTEGPNLALPGDFYQLFRKVLRKLLKRRNFQIKLYVNNGYIGTIRRLWLFPADLLAVV